MPKVINITFYYVFPYLANACIVLMMDFKLWQLTLNMHFVYEHYINYVEQECLPALGSLIDFTTILPL